MIDICKEEKIISARIDELTDENVADGERCCTELLRENSFMFSDRRASAALSRCLCRFLLHKRCKNTFLKTIKENEIIRTAFFGELNTYKYSIVWILKRVIRSGDEKLLKECMDLLSKNPYRDDGAKDYESRWSMKFLVEETLKAPEEYLKITDEQMKIMNLYLY